MSVCDCIVGLVASIEKAESLKSCYQKSLNGLECLYSALSQQTFKSELDLLHVLQEIQQLEGEQNK